MHLELKPKLNNMNVLYVHIYDLIYCMCCETIIYFLLNWIVSLTDLCLHDLTLHSSNGSTRLASTKTTFTTWYLLVASWFCGSWSDGLWGTRKRTTLIQKPYQSHGDQARPYTFIYIIKESLNFIRLCNWLAP